MNDKIKWLRDKIKGLDLQGMIISNPINIKYLTGIEAEGILLITRKENIFLTDGRYIEDVNNKITINDEIVVHDVSKLTEYEYESYFLFCENVGFEENHLTYAKYKEFKQRFKINNLEETEYIIEKARMIKDNEEILKIRMACELTDKCFEYIKEYITIGKTEKDIAEKIEQFFIENGADEVSFSPIVASGENASKPHAIPTDKTIKNGDCILLDFGCKYKGYCSDMTRTIFIGKVSESWKSIYNLVLDNQEKVLSLIKDGENTRNISRIVEGNFKLRNYDLIHGLGHGLGLEIHELPSIGKKAEYILKENMVVTDEPGIYIPNLLGIRIEDTVLVTKDGCETLTKSSKELTII